jgi:hypothetical protein
MPHRYTDVDRLLLGRWSEAVGVRDAFDGLLMRMRSVVESAMQRAATAASEKEWRSESNVKRPSIWFWTRDWENRRGEPGVYIEVFDFVPAEYGKDVEPYPSTWLMLDQLSRLRLRESDEDVGRAIRTAISPDLFAKWNHVDVDLTEGILGRDHVEITSADRLRLVSEADALTSFINEALADASELVPLVDEALRKMTRK